MRGWQGQPRKMVEYEHWPKKQAKMSIVGLTGCRFQFGGAKKSSSAITPQNPSTISRHAVRVTQGACWCLVLSA
jgi:hypothetical protein